MHEDFIKETLKKNLEVAEETLKILKRMERTRRINSIFKIIKWVVVIAISLGVYYYIEPYLRGTFDALNSAISTLNELQKTGESLNTPSISPDLLKNLESLKGTLPR